MTRPFTREWFRAAGERAVKTAAQTTAAVVTVGTTGLTSVNWTVAGLTILGATLASLVTSVISPDARKGVGVGVVKIEVAAVEKAVLPAIGPPEPPPPGATIPAFAPPPQ